MLVHRVELHRFMSHDESAVDLPERGLVVVTGDNGSGKSALLEGVAMGLWGKTLRGSMPWRGDTDGSVEVRVPGLTAIRSRKGGRTRLGWTSPDGTTDYESTTKAQAALEAMVGTFDAWRRTSVFSSQDAAHFTMATDAERKRLLEGLLGLDRFDGALARCRDELRAAERTQVLARTDLARAEAEAESGRRLAEQAGQALAAMPAAPPGAAAPSAELRGMASRAAQEAQAARDAELRASREAGGHRARFQAAAVLATHLDGRADCPTCLRPVDAALLRDLRGRAEVLREEARTADVRQRAALDALASEARELAAEAAALALRLREGEALARAAGDARAVRERLGASLERARASVLEAEESASRLRAREGTLVREAEVLGACDRVLGMRGVRAHVLGRVLGGLEAAANAWLGRFAGPGVALRLRSYREKADGGTVDALALEVEGLAGGLGYRGCSGGQRRRIDVALLLALAEVAAGATGRPPGTLWIDEAFDSLDEEGTEAVAGALAEMAEERPVVVVTHSEGLQRRLPAVQRVRVEAGRLEVSR